MSQTPRNQIINQIISHMILQPKSYGILKEFFESLDKYEIEYEVDISMALIKIKGHIIRSVCGSLFTIYFEQGKGKRINISPTAQADNIEIIIFTRTLKKRFSGASLTS